MTAGFIYELIGYGASILTITSLLMANVLRLRVINLFACISWGIYGLLIHAPAVIVTNVILMGVNIFFIIRLLAAKELFNLVEIRKDSAFLKQFLTHYDSEIKTFYPDFIFDESQDIYIFIAFRNVIAAGLFIVEVREGNQLFLKLEFTIPGYRDFRISRYIYSDGSAVLRSALENGFAQIYSDIPKEPKQTEYLMKMGYKENLQKQILCLNVTDYDLSDPTGTAPKWK